MKASTWVFILLGLGFMGLMLEQPFLKRVAVFVIGWGIIMGVIMAFISTSKK